MKNKEIEKIDIDSLESGTISKPKRNIHIGCRVSESEHLQIVNIANIEDLEMSKIIRNAIKEFLKKYE